MNRTDSTTGNALKITESDIRDNLRLELEELEGNILDGKIVYINAAGLENGGLRNSLDGCTYWPAAGE